MASPPMHWRHIRDGSFIDDYMTFMEGQETSSSYDFWAAAWLLGCAVGRDFIINRPRAPIHFNHYIIIAAESGITRKSTAVRLATDVLHKFLGLNPSYHVEVVQAKATPEGLEYRMHQLSQEFGYAHVAISISELVTFLGRERYTMAMPGLLTDLYDSPSVRQGGGTIERGAAIHNNVYVNFLSASTPSWLARAVNPDVVEGGFTSRVLFIHAEHRKKKIPWPEDCDLSLGLDRLAERLSRIREKALELGEVIVSPSGRTAYDNWYVRRGSSTDPFLASFESREDAHVLRLAGILAISTNRWSIDAQDIIRAAQIVRNIKHAGALIFDKASQRDKSIVGIERLREILLKEGKRGIAQRELYLRVRNYFNRVAFHKVLDLMHELEMVQKFVIKTGKQGKPKTIWRATDKLKTIKATEELSYEFDGR